jgi:polyhydroxyalkanoate synthase
MSHKTTFDDFKNYSHKLECVLEGLRDHETASARKHSPRELIFQDKKLSLYHYLSSTTENINTTPVLIVYALVNRPTILDLQKNCSAIVRMLEHGLDVYLVDWGYPDKDDSDLNLDDYINRQLNRCVEAVCKAGSVDSINILGVCQGGTLSLCYSALYPARIKNLVLMVTPVDFQTENDMLSHWVRHIDIDLMVNTLGNIPGSMLSNTLIALRPYRLQLQKYLNLIDSIDQFENIQERISGFLAMEEWIFDSPDQAGEMFREYIISCYQKNLLIKGELTIADRHIKLDTLSMPVLNIYAQQDHIVPPDASRALKKLVSSADYQEVPVPGGHIGLFVRKKSLDQLFPAICKWFQERD